MNIYHPFLLLFLGYALHLHAQWQPDGVAACNASGHQLNQAAVSDTSGAIIAWEDYRGADGDIYARKVDMNGVLLWQTNGVAICTAAGHQVFPIAISDGAGGAFIAWEDYRSSVTSGDIYAQRLSPAGTPLWTSNGLQVCNAVNVQQRPALLDDGQGGIFIVWEDYRSGQARLYGQRISSAGIVQWQSNGALLSTAQGARYTPVIAPDGSGGALVAWSESRSANEYDIYAQRISASGALLWGSGGIPVCTATGAQLQLAGCVSSHGNMFLVWQDYRGSSPDIYAQMLTPAGAAWQSNGIGVCMESGTQESPRAVGDGSGGLIVAWTDYRNGNGDVYARRIGATGTPAWASGGVVLCAASGTQHEPSIVSNGAGGALVAWLDYRTPSGDVYMQAVDNSGVPLWQQNGIAVCSHSAVQQRPITASDHRNGAIVAWTDYRGPNGDIFVQRVNQNGAALPVDLISFSGQRRDGRVLLRWRTAAESGLLGFEVQGWNSGGFRTECFVPAKSPGGAEYEIAVLQSEATIYRLRMPDADGSYSHSPSIEILQEAPCAFQLVSLSPLPARSTLHITLDALSQAPLRFEIIDPAGRVPLIVDDFHVHPGRHIRRLDLTGLPSGFYLFRMSSAEGTVVRLLPLQGR